MLFSFSFRFNDVCEEEERRLEVDVGVSILYLG